MRSYDRCATPRLLRLLHRALPHLGITRFTQPYSLYDNCLIAWAGVLAQLIVGVPLVAFVELFGYTRFQSVNASLSIFGFLSLLAIPLNLIPVPPLDGAIAWRLLPVLLRRRPTQPPKREPSYRSWR